MRFLFLSLLFVVTALFQNLAMANSDSLLVAVQARDFGGLNSPFEKLLAGYLKKSFQGKYKKIYIWRAEEGIPAKTLLENIISQRESGEKLDVISVLHGPLPSFLNIDQKDVEVLVPRDFVHHIFMSSCDEWGSLVGNPDKLRILWQTHVGEHFQRLGVEEYILYTDGNNSWPLTLPKLARTFSADNSWLESFVAFYPAVLSTMSSYRIFNKRSLVVIGGRTLPVKDSIEKQNVHILYEQNLSNGTLEWILGPISMEFAK